MKIVVLDGFTLNPGDNPWDELAERGELEVYDRTPPEEVVARAAGAEIVLTNKTPLGAAEITALPDLRFIAVLATGYNVVDLDAASAAGVLVSNVPEYGTDGVAQHTMALLLELTNQVAQHADDVAAGAWTRCPDFCFWRQSPVELAGATFGVVGFGRIGRRVGELAHAFGMRVLACGRRGGDAPGDVGYPYEWVSQEEVFAKADVVSLHCPQTAENERFVDAALLATMKPTAFLLNTGRGPLIDEYALRDALIDGRLAAAALDVVSTEPMPEGHPLLDAPRCRITPHIAWASLTSRRRLMKTVVANVDAYLTQSPQNLVPHPT